MKDKFFIFDLDGTLIYYKNGYEGLYDIFSRQGLDYENIKSIYLDSVKSGFSIKKMIDIAQKKIDQKLNNQIIEKEFDNWVKSNLKVYKDMPSGLFGLNNDKKDRHGIITWGDDDLQKYKMNIMNIRTDNLWIVHGFLQKGNVLKSILEEYNNDIVYTDNSLEELNAIANVCWPNDSLRLCHINRKKENKTYSNGIEMINDLSLLFLEKN